MHQSPPNSPDQGPQQQYNPPPSMAYPQGQGYPPPQAYYGPPPGPPGYSHNVVVHQQPTVTNVVVSGSAQLGPNPATMTCPHCSAHITTTIHRQCGAYVWMMAGIICLIGLLVGVVLIGCCLIPFCIPSCYDAEHTCPNCGKFVGHFKRM